MFTLDDMNKINADLEKDLNKEIEKSFKDFKDSLLRSANNFNLPDGLEYKLETFINENKHLFYRDFKTKLKNKALSRFKLSFKADHLKDTALEVETVFDSFNLKDENVSPKSFDTYKDDLFKKTYLSLNKNASASARRLGIAKSTFHDWIKNNKDFLNQ